jgi:MoxR-like ATPase
MALSFDAQAGEVDRTFDTHLDAVFESPEKILKGLAAVGYMTDLPTAKAVWDAYDQNLPILQEGPPGAGKTVLSTAIQKMTTMEIERLQCYEGLTNKDAFGDWNSALQQLYILANKDRNLTFEQIKKDTQSITFFNPGALLRSITTHRRVILLVDEVDKTRDSFEAMLLELTGEWQISDRDFGTFKAITKPFVILTSNATRELGDALRRRCVTIFVKHPTPELEAKVVALQAPDLPLETKLFIAGFAQALRVEGRMEKPPSISEMKHLARSMQRMGLTELRAEHRELFLHLIAKRQNDIASMRREDQFGWLVKLARKKAMSLDPKCLELDVPEQQVPVQGAV